jgi:hypothetical protein
MSLSLHQTGTCKALACSMVDYAMHPAIMGPAEQWLNPTQAAREAALKALGRLRLSGDPQSGQADSSATAPDDVRSPPKVGVHHVIHGHRHMLQSL